MVEQDFIYFDKILGYSCEYLQEIRYTGTLYNAEYIDFDKVWKLLEYSRKDSAKRLLYKNFILNVDYKVSSESSGAIKSMYNNEKILFNINAFKRFCRLSNKQKAGHILDVLIKTEDFMKLFPKDIYCKDVENNVENNVKDNDDKVDYIDESLELFVDKLNFEDFDKEVDECLHKMTSNVKQTSNEYQKKYRENNKDKYNKYQREYQRKNNKTKLENPDKFKDGKIYKLNHFDKMIYIGSTTLPLDVRLKYHKMNSENIKYNTDLYKYIRVHGIDNIKIELIENYNCNNRNELLLKESEYILLHLDKILNKNIPY